MEIPVFSTYFLKYLMTILVFAGIGKLILPQKEGAPYYNAFFNIFFSAILFSTVFALWKAKMITVMLGFVIWFILWLVYSNKSDAFILKHRRFYYSISLRYLLRTGALLLALLGLFLWAYFSRVQAEAFPFVIPEGTALAPNDIHIYALRSYYLGLTGHENYFGIYNTFDTNFHGPKPYHYLELWLNAGLGHILGGLNILNLSLITAPVFQAISLLGILALWERFLMIRWYHILLCFVFLWLAGLYLFYDKIGFPSFSLPIMTYRFKMVVYYPFVLGYALCFVHEEWKKGILLLLGLPLATIVAAPSVLGGLILFITGYWIFATAKKMPLAYWCLQLAMIFGFLSLFYWLTGSDSSGTTFELGQSDIVNTFDFQQLISNIPPYLLRFFYGLIHLGLLYAPFFFIYLLFRHHLFIQVKKHRTFFLINFCLIISGAAAWALLEGFAQSSQLFYNMAIPLLNVTGILLLILIAKEFRIHIFNKKSWMFASIFLLIVASQVYQVGKTHFKERGKQIYSTRYLLQIDSLVQSGRLSPVGGALKGPEDYRSEYSKMVAGYTLGYYLQYMKNGYATVSLSDFDIPINPDDRRNNLKDIQSGALYQFVERQKAANKFISTEKSQLEFLRKNKINFLILSANGQLPSILADYITFEIKDSISGERFLIIELLSY